MFDREKIIKGTIMLLEGLNLDLEDQHLLRTPIRVAETWTKTLAKGYTEDPEQIIMKAKFKDPSYSEIVLLKDIPFFSTCSHHLLPFSGTAHIAYVPDGQVLGISKLVRLLECFSRRLQVQEVLCSQITQSLMTYLKPKGAACVINATHACMTERGVQKAGASMITSSLAGCFLDDVKTRAELMSLIGMKKG